MPLGQLLAHAHPANEALVWSDGSLTYGELDQQTTELACALLDEGLQPGDRVAVHWSNAVQPVLLYFACFKAGLIIVPVNLRLKVAEAEHIFRHSGAKVCFSQPELASIAETAASSCGTGIVVRQQLPHGAAVRPLPEPEDRAICALMYTSGTTAQPKGVMHSHASLFHGARFTLEAGSGRGVTLTTTQISHMSGFQCVLVASMLGQAKLVLVPKFDPVGRTGCGGAAQSGVVHCLAGTDADAGGRAVAASARPEFTEACSERWRQCAGGNTAAI